MSLLRLRSHDLLEDRDAVAMGDREVPRVGLRDTNAQQLAVLGEDLRMSLDRLLKKYRT
jgi:hypothetical protein